MMAKNEMTAKLVELAKKHPELPIVPAVNSEPVASNDYDWWLGSITDVKIGRYAISEYGEGSVVIWNDDLQDMCYSFFGDNGFTDEEAREKLKDVTWTDAILIHVGLPK